MKNNLKYIALFANLVLFFGVFNYLIIQKENTLSEGKLIFLKLNAYEGQSPVHGDYVSLDYELIDNWRRTNQEDSAPIRGFFLLALDDKNIATYAALQSTNTVDGPNQIAVKYYGRRWSVHIGAESFYVEEGKHSFYEKAAYGGLRVAADGSVLLDGLYDENLVKL